MTEKEPITSQPVVSGDIVVTPRHVSAEHTNVDLEKLPVGLKVLSQASSVTVRQHIDSVEVVVCCIARPCRYSVYPNEGSEQFFYIQEVSECYARQIMGAGRSFALKFSDPDNIDIVKVVRPQTCSRGCCGICCHLPILFVENPPGNRVAYITEKRTCCYPKYHIYNMDDSVKYILSPRCCYSSVFGLCSDIVIDIYDQSGGTIVAQLCKQTKGSSKEFFGQANSFTVKYLSDCTVTDKVILLGSAFLIDFHYFERQQRCCC